MDEAPAALEQELTELYISHLIIGKMAPAVGSHIPTLVPSGEFDPVTLPAFCDLAVQALAYGVHVEFPCSSHGVLSKCGCARRIADALLGDPRAEPNLGRMESLRRQPPAFVIR